VVETLVDDTRVAAIIKDSPPEVGATVHLHFQPQRTRLYRDDWLATSIAEAAQ
jgi:glycerol transport system ATP-binding protein